MLLLAFGGPYEDRPINHESERMFYGAIGNPRTEKSAPNATCFTPRMECHCHSSAKGLNEVRGEPIPSLSI